MQAVEQVDGFTVGMSTDNNVLNRVDDAGKLEDSGLCSNSCLGDLAAVRHHVPGVPHDEHVPHLGLREPGWQHSRVYTCEEYSCRNRIVTNLFKLVDHVSLVCESVFHQTPKYLLHPVPCFTHPSLWVAQPRKP